MIETIGDLVGRLSKIKKRNLCTYDTSLEDARIFCVQIMEVVSECRVDSKYASKIFQEYFEDCFTSIKDVPFKFKQFENLSVGRVCEMGTLDYAVGVISNLSSGSEFSYDLITEQFEDLNKTWLNNQYEVIKNIEEEKEVLRQLEEETKRLEEENRRLEQEREERLAREREMGPYIYTVNKLQRKLGEIKKVDLCNENTTDEEAMQFCKELMTVVYCCKIDAKEVVDIFKEFLVPDCFTKLENVPERFKQNFDEKFIIIRKMQTIDYPLNLINNLASGDIDNCIDAIQWYTKSTKKWLTKNGVELEDEQENIQENLTKQENISTEENDLHL